MSRITDEQIREGCELLSTAIIDNREQIEKFVLGYLNKDDIKVNTVDKESTGKFNNGILEHLNEIANKNLQKSTSV